MRVAILQPYLFPYIGYFKLINSVDTFIFYDDVNFIKKGWINRNKILVNKESYLFSIPCNKISQNKLINEIYVVKNSKRINKLLETVQKEYINAPYYSQVFPIIEKVFLSIKNDITISELAAQSVLTACEYLRIDCDFKTSSKDYPNSIILQKEKRIISICKESKALTYINPIGGIDLYSKKVFERNGIRLKFLKSFQSSYKQYENDYIPRLSIIDVMMFNSVEQIKVMLNEYRLT